ncbi:MAG TPA: adenosylcobalamin-dependent ribonucleoside-diphosphate reductase [Elusimicrobiota bacterium]|jgi:ribonucleoside-diphosphate reductase alpha chain|nr:adenosylcobalamin-dependent ribonucleoside-diphosphate reductase [Elusimicrobiota bacterium]HMZ25794.1 adenosylcobalamin-dependent ribonucleoside-diphosphate reductase [Elusimicrobiota bacterium]HNA60265.1 adenosylcobalamin-dependent ribonucleoside-diphosphate reductase [Elusimicrobiota bacterium]HND64209.1 adenosylcobalamin-dependent ribonucleoside-diphosphate reductase [Elusimicrobiota bacterium]HNI56016.1 adenosylcobalamin-dependent ribonucleoside-diphosphate reductase [Elusimicrobiota ba
MNPVDMKARPQDTAKTRPPVRLTENQRKVIQDKYLRTDPSAEVWLERVAANIALAELLHAAEADGWHLWDGVKRKAVDLPTRRGQKSRMNLLHHGLTSSDERDKNFFTFLGNLRKAATEIPEARALAEEWRDKFYAMLARFDFLPNSPTLMNAGRDLQQLSACYVLPVPDTMEGIADALKAQALIHKSGGGTGFSFQRLRPSGDVVKSTKGTASGSISFMQIFDKMTDVVKQGGTRRGANMGILPYWHPEIEEFIHMKEKPGVMENFNVSVTVDEKFMTAVEKGEDYDLLNPRTMEPTGKKMNAREVFDHMVDSAWKSGDPGIIFIDRINNSASNPTPHLGQIESTNPCGEQPLLPNEPCNLGSINLANFVEGDLTQGKMNWERLGETVALAVRFLDDVIDVNNYPLPPIEELSKGNRRIGLGVMGWAEALIKMGISYDTDDCLNMAKEVMGFVNDKAMEASEALAEERGAFPNWKGSIFDPDSKHFRGAEHLPRHCARTTIAPTGTIGLAAGLQGAGIEPFFAIAYTRYNAKALDALKKGEKPNESDVFHEVNPLFREVARRNGYFGLPENELWKKIEANHKSVRGVKEIPERFQKLFASSHDVAVPFHVLIQAAFQTHTDNAVSKTINMPNTATRDDVKEAYWLSYKMGCKGITIYRDGSKSQQVLNLGGAQAEKPKARDASRGMSSEYYEIRTGHGGLHVHIDYDEEGPYRLFTSLSPLGTDISGLTSVVGIMISKYLETGGDPKRILKHLNSVKGDRPFGFGAQRVDSIPHAIAIALRTHLQKHGKMETPPTEAAGGEKGLELWNRSSALYCPDCFSSNVAQQSGCTGVTCFDCGHSECS